MCKQLSYLGHDFHRLRSGIVGRVELIVTLGREDLDFQKLRSLWLAGSPAVTDHWYRVLWSFSKLLAHSLRWPLAVFMAWVTLFLRTPISSYS